VGCVVLLLSQVQPIQVGTFLLLWWIVDNLRYHVLEVRGRLLPFAVPLAVG